MTRSEPRSWDLVLGTPKPATAPLSGLVLGGVEGVQRRLLNQDLEVRLAAIPDCLNYGHAGLNLLIEALAGNTEWAVRLQAWRTLSQVDHPDAQQATYSLSPFRPIGGDQGLMVAYRRGERDFSYVDLPDAVLDSQALGGASFYEANLRASCLRGSNLNGAQLVKTDLRQANLSGSKLSGALLYQTDLRGAHLLNVKISGTNLRESQLSEETKLDPKVRLVWELQNGGGRARNLVQQDLSKTDLRELDLKSIEGTATDFTGVDCRQSTLAGAILADSIWRRADLRGANLQDADLRGANLSGANLEGADLRGADLTRADATQANLNRANLTQAKIEGLRHSQVSIMGLTFPDGSSIKPWWW